MVYCTASLIAGASLLLFAAPPVSAEEGDAPHTLRLLTFNVLVNWENKEGVPPWKDRRALCLAVTQEADADLIGFQETAPKQADFFRDNLPGYGVVGEIALSEEQVAAFSEILPIVRAMNITRYTDALLFYREALFDKLDEGHWWLSSTPEKLSADFGNEMPRIMVWAKLRHKPSGRLVVVAVTHFDNTLPSQVHMARLAHEKLQPFIDAGLPVIFMGDFNTSHERGDYGKLTEGAWTDSYLVSPEASDTGVDSNVSTRFGGQVRIDHIFYHGAGFDALAWKRIESPDPDRVLSDHFPVFAEIAWK
ncbi:MAG: endonuclease/exonuclease/phosphatase family protein [Candidatus Hydrogenedentota bacterium]